MQTTKALSLNVSKDKARVLLMIGQKNRQEWLITIVVTLISINYSTVFLVIRSVTDVLRAKSRFVKLGGGGGAQAEPHTHFTNLNYSTVFLVIRSLTDVIRAKSRFVKLGGGGGEATSRTPYTFYKPALGLKCVSNRPYNEFITPTTFI